MALVKDHLTSPYTPDQMRKVLEMALSPSPLVYKSISPNKNIESGYSSETSSEYSYSGGENTRPSSHAYPEAKSNSRPNLSANECTPGIIELGSTPVRPFYTPSSSHKVSGTPTPTTYEVEAPFLKAMIGLLERQANLVPQHVMTRSDVRKIVGKELDKKRDEKAGCKRPRTLDSHVTPSKVLGATMGMAGFAVFARAWRKHPKEMAEYLEGAWKGGLAGFVGAMAVKMALWGLGRLSCE